MPTLRKCCLVTQPAAPPADVIENAVQARDGVATDDLRVLNLPERGSLNIAFDQQYIAFDAGKKVEYAKGPWTLSIDLAQSK